MKKNKKNLIGLWITSFLFIISIAIIVVGFNSNYLITKLIRNVSIGISVVLIILFIYFLIMVIKNRHRNTFKLWVKILINSILAIELIGCITFLILLYGGYKPFKEWLVTTSMQTMNHQYICKIFYDKDTINHVLNSNYIVEVDEDTDKDLVDKEEVKYKNKYEKEILEHNKDDLYKIIRFKVNGCDAYLAAVYDASKISVGVTKYLGRSGQYAKDMAKDNKAVLAINGGGFYDPNYNSNGGIPLGVTISHGKVITNYPDARGIIGFTKDDVLVLRRTGNAKSMIKEGFRDAVSMGPFLIVNGKPSFIKGNGGWGYAARTAIGQRSDGIVLFLVVDSNEFRTKGASMVDLTKIMQRYGAINASNLDGGTSTNLVENGKLINDPIDSTLQHRTRGIPTIFMVKE